MTIRVLLIDGPTLMREGIKAALQSERDIQVVGECGSEGSEPEKALALSPHIVIMDVPATDGREGETIRRIKEHCPSTKILALASYASMDLFRKVATAGATGYDLKDISPESLARVVRALHSGKTMLHSEIARQMVEALSGNGAGTKQHGLTPRQVDILAAVAQGLADKEIAERLFLSKSTVKSHLRAIYHNLRLRNRAQATAFVVEKGLLQAPR